MDITKVLVCNIGRAQGVPSANDSTLSTHTQADEFSIGLLSEKHLVPYLKNAEYEIDTNTVSSLESPQVTCVGAYVDQQLAGYIFFCDSPVEAQRNSGGSRFNGIGLEFSAQVRYLYKVLVIPEYRGRQLAAQMIQYAADYFRSQQISCLVTTTDWTNKAFLKTCRSVGFKQTGIAGEIVLLGKHLFMLPSEIREPFIRFVRP